MSKKIGNELKTYSDQIIDHIKRSLLRGEIMPGDKVNEVHLATTLSISRAPVREALLGLVTEGLIENIPQRGKFIRALTAKEIKDSYSIGGVLEGAAVAESVHLFTEEDFQAMEALVRAMDELQEDSPCYAEDLSGLDIDFHIRIFSKNSNQLIGEYTRRACRRISRFLLFRHWPSVYTKQEIVLRHKKVLEAVRSGNAAEVERVIREHYRELGERMSQYGSDTEKADKKDSGYKRRSFE